MGQSVWSCPEQMPAGQWIWLLWMCMSNANKRYRISSFSDELKKKRRPRCTVTYCAGHLTWRAQLKEKITQITSQSSRPVTCPFFSVYSAWMLHFCTLRQPSVKRKLSEENSESKYNERKYLIKRLILYWATPSEVKVLVLTIKFGALPKTVYSMCVLDDISINTRFTSCQVPPFLIDLLKVSSLESAIVLLVMAPQCLKMHFTIMIQVMKAELQWKSWRSAMTSSTHGKCVLPD